MSVLPDWMIESQVKITPFSPGVHRPGVISYGTTSYGYDARAGDDWRVFDRYIQTDVDPKNFNPKMLTPLAVYQGERGQYVLIPPHTVALGETVEEFTIPRDVLCIVVGKSTYARCGLIVNVTPGEPDWVGKWTIEVSNTTPIPARLYVGEGIMQCVFHRGEKPCRTSYADRKGVYMYQTGLTLPKVCT